MALGLRPGEAVLTRDRQFADVLCELDGSLRGYLRRNLAGRDVVDDAVQETHLRMLRYRGLDDPGEIRALLFKVAGSVVADHYRHIRRHPDEDYCAIEDVDLPSGAPEQDRLVAGREDFARIKSAIAGLPPRCREVFVLNRFENLSYRQIAARYGTSVRTVENQIAHALAVCRAALGRAAAPTEADSGIGGRRS